MNYLYLLLNLGSISIPFVFSFHPRLQFYKKWKPLFFSTIITAVFYIFWDVFFTQWNVWGFNPTYFIGITFFGLPLEECLFFLCIPYACVFTHFSLLELFPNVDYSKNIFKIIMFVLLLASFTTAIVFYDRWYTLVNYAYFSFLVGVGLYFNPKLLQQFSMTFLVILIPFFLVNGILTGSFIENEVVWYNNNENLGIRIATIPIEDMAYAFTMIFTNLLLLDYFSAKKKPI